MMEGISHYNFTVQVTSCDKSVSYLANNEYSRVLLFGLSSLHASRLCCDVTLEAGNVPLPAHKVVLAATSPYFHKMFSHDFQESLSNVVKFPDVSPAVMKTVLNFIYSGKVNISDDSVKDILKVAHLFDLNFLIEACRLHLKRNLLPKNAVATLHLSNLYGFKDLTVFSLKCIADNFNKLSKDILKLTSSELLEVIRNDKLGVRHEDDVLRVVTNWIELNKEANDATVFNLMKSVRMSECSCEETRKLLKEHQELPGSSFTEIVEYCKMLSYLGRSFKVPDLYLVGGNGSELTLTRLDLESKKYSELPALPNPREDHGCALVGEKLYVVGGGTTEVDCYDSDKNCWLSCSPTSELRSRSVIVELGGMIYACGGYINDWMSKTVERYDPEKDEWTEVASMINLHDDACGAVVNGRIYVISGKGTEGISDFCEYYDPVKNSWESIAPIPEALHLASASAVQGALFVTGGLNESDHSSDKVYKYNVENGAWSSCPNMPIDRYSHKSCAFLNSIYVFGGISKISPDDLSVLIFDTASFTWTKETALKSKVSYFAGCFDL